MKHFHFIFRFHSHKKFWKTVHLLVLIYTRSNFNFLEWVGKRNINQIWTESPLVSPPIEKYVVDNYRIPVRQLFIYKYEFSVFVHVPLQVWCYDEERWRVAKVIFYCTFTSRFLHFSAWNIMHAFESFLEGKFFTVFCFVFGALFVW